MSHNRQEESMLREFLMMEEAVAESQQKRQKNKVENFREYYEKGQVS